MRVALLCALALLAGGCAGGSGTGEPEVAPATTGAPSPTATSTATGEPEQVAGDLHVPWGIAFVSEDVLLVSERSGAVRVVEDGRVRPEPAAELDVVDDGEAGLLGIALHPGFPQERFAYLFYTHASGNRLSRFAVGDDLRLVDEELLVGEIPSAPFHDGGRIAFGPDGMLYVTTGDARRPELAADRGSLAGKILRLTPEGTVPADNPFGDSPVYSYGHRNPQGLAWSADGTLYASEHGPTGEFGLCCHDEVNRIEPGGFYGWPYRAGTSDTGQGSPPDEPIDPVVSSGEDTWAPAGLAASGDGTLLVALLAGERLLRVDPAAGDVETALDGYGRLRLAATGPDGCLYVGTSNRDGRGDPAEGDDRLLRRC